MEFTHNNILIIKPSALGDVVHALPALAALRKARPQAKISWLIRPEFAPLLACAEGLDETLLFDRKLLGRWFTPAGFKALKSLILQLRAGQFDLVLDMQGLLRTALLGWVANCPVRVGMAAAREGATLFYTHRARPPGDALHMAERYQAMLAAVGITEWPQRGTLTPPPAAREHAAALLADTQLDGRFAVLIPSAQHASKCWPIERFAAVAEQIHKRYGLPIAAVGAPGDKRLVAALRDVCSVPVADLCGRTTLPELVAVLSKAALVVSNDTGPGHIAAAMGVATVLIFGPTNPGWVAPYKQPDTVVAIDPDRRGRAIRSRNPDHAIERVTVQRVVEAIDRRMKQDTGEDRP